MVPTTYTNYARFIYIKFIHNVLNIFMLNYNYWNKKVYVDGIIIS